MKGKSLITRSVSLTAAVLLAGNVLFTTNAQSNNSFFQHNILSDLPGQADGVDPNLVNPWGLFSSATSPFWITNQGKSNTGIYNSLTGAPPSTIITIGGAKGATTGRPTGGVNNASTAFLLPSGARATWIFDTEDGTIAGFSGGTTTVTVIDNSSSGAVYKGLAIGANSSGPLIYAANFNAGTIEVYDGKFAPTTVSGGFKDPNLPAGYAPFNIWPLNGKLFVAYAKQDANKQNDSSGPGNGYINIFDMDGVFQKRLISNDVLNSPWGMAIAPANWGPFGGALLVGNFGNGRINAFDQNTGAFMGTLQNQSGAPIVNQGLWGLLFGNGRAGGDVNTLYFVAGIGGPDNKVHGLFGGISPSSTVLSVQNAASGATGAVAPGEVVVLNGFTLGTYPLVSARIPAGGAVDIALSGTSVTFNGTSAPILYASASAVSAIVPYEVAGSTSANVVLKFGSQTTAALQVPVAAAAPGVFTLAEGGTGAAVALNQDGTLNTAANAAARGSAILFFATGEGVVSPAGPNGAVVSGPFVREPNLAVTATVGGLPAKVVYAGTAPGQVLGVMEVEAIVSAASPTGAVPVVVTVGTANSQANVTVFVK